jgi:CP family cyanate transporter-like MFS transporter
VSDRVRWAAIFGYYLIGVFSAAQLGKMSALAPLVAADLHLSLTTVAAAISLLEAGGALLGAVAGLLALRVGLRRTLLGGLACLAAAGFGTALAQGAGGLIGWRLLESLGHLGVIVTVPVLIATVAGPSVRVALALWSSFVPVGLALGAWGWGGLGMLMSWRAAMVVGGALALVALAACAWSRPARPAPPSGAVRAAPPATATAFTSATSATSSTSAASAGRVGPEAWCLALSFGCCTLYEVGLLALLPSYLVDRAGASAPVAAHWTAVASVSAVLGSLVAAVLARRHVAPLLPTVATIVLPGLMLFSVFVESPSVLPVALMAAALNAIAGMYFSLAFAWLPAVAGGPAGMVRANGLIAQFGAGGALAGPPLMAACVERWGWPAAAVAGAAVALLAVPLAWRALRGVAIDPKGSVGQAL